MNILGTKDCFGCGVCAIVCSKKIIHIILNEKGFYEPYIDDISKCTKCGLCVSVCSYHHDDISTSPNLIQEAYAAWSNDSSNRLKSTSGGIGFEIGKHLMANGYKACGVRYNVAKNIAEHFVANTIEEYLPSMGSKYIQSYTVEGFTAINRNEKFLVTGTPCQIDSFRRYLRKFHCEDNFILVDFFCHGVPSKLLWNKYIREAENKVGKIQQVSWRNKIEFGKLIGWHSSYNMHIKGTLQESYSRWSDNDPFYLLFLGDACLGKHCTEKCRFKALNSAADIRIGDMWGNLYKDSQEGVSCAIAFTQKGDDILHSANICLQEIHIAEITAKQLDACAVPASYANTVLKQLQDEKIPLKISTKYPIRQKRIREIYNKIKRNLKKIFK